MKNKCTLKDLEIPPDEWDRIEDEEKIIRKLKGEPEPKSIVEKAIDEFEREYKKYMKRTFIDV